LNTIADMQKVAELLAKRNYKQADIEAIMHGNWIRFFFRSPAELGERPA